MQLCTYGLPACLPARLPVCPCVLMYASTCLFVDRCGSTNLLTDHTHRGFEVRVYRGLRDFWGCVFMLRSVYSVWGLSVGGRQGALVVKPLPSGLRGSDVGFPDV